MSLSLFQLIECWWFLVCWWRMIKLSVHGNDQTKLNWFKWKIFLFAEPRLKLLNQIGRAVRVPTDRNKIVWREGTETWIHGYPLWPDSGGVCLSHLHSSENLRGQDGVMIMIMTAMRSRNISDHKPLTYLGGGINKQSTSFNVKLKISP